MATKVYRINRAEFYELILEFDFTNEEIANFIQDWEDIIRAHPDDSYSPYLELNDLRFLYSVTEGDGKRAVEYLNTIGSAGDVISDESWEKFKNGKYYTD